VQSVPNTITAVSSNPTYGEVYSIQHYVLKFVSDLRWFSPGPPVSSTNETESRDITEILLKMSLNTIIATLISELIIIMIYICYVDTL
jgi:hypothetical protein